VNRLQANGRAILNIVIELNYFVIKYFESPEITSDIR
jgi:hypothetical protein